MSENLTPVVGDGLTIAEQGRLSELEAVVERGMQTFVEVGHALMEIRDARLHRVTHATFEAYLDERWGMSRSRGYRLMDAARVAEIVSPIGDIANEAQARELVPLLDHPDRLREVWGETLRRAESGQVTADLVREVAAAETGDDSLARFFRDWADKLGIPWESIEEHIALQNAAQELLLTGKPSPAPMLSQIDAALQGATENQVIKLMNKVKSDVQAWNRRVEVVAGGILIDLDRLGFGSDSGHYRFTLDALDMDAAREMLCESGCPDIAADDDAVRTWARGHVYGLVGVWLEEPSS